MSFVRSLPGQSVTVGVTTIEKKGKKEEVLSSFSLRLRDRHEVECIRGAE